MTRDNERDERSLDDFPAAAEPTPGPATDAEMFSTEVVEPIENGAPDGDDETPVELPDKPVTVPQGALLALDDIQLLDNPRGDVGDVSGLAESIRVGGLLHPVVVRASPDGERPYQLIVGYRRYAAHQLLERVEIPVLITDAADTDVQENVITENLQRRGWSPMAEARAMQRMIDVLGYNRSRVAAALGVNRSQVTKRLSLLALPEKVRELVASETLTASHAEVLVGLKTPEAQEEMAELAVKSGAPVNKLSSWTKKVKEQEDEAEAAEEALSAKAIDSEVVAEALLDEHTPLENAPTLPISSLPRMRVGVWEEEERARALLYLLLRAANDREILQYLEREHGIEQSGLWEFVSGTPASELDEMIDNMLARWYGAPHRYSTFPSSLRAALGDGEEMVPPREPAPAWQPADNDDWDDWEDDWEDDA
jgi:ParB family transcriptional regulator, chromosome partitioning protein